MVNCCSAIFSFFSFFSSSFFLFIIFTQYGRSHFVNMPR
ncbi:unnamed protein product [Tuber melanosporum]|uniref:(Perigord truffle) hypothetical protein n=1 Tax=Tuber melanosporum (strain Mel28) TaxID=656061 RepID=D5GMI8_TUBMM|nr:uncharacterized protein GSTUM_00010747001 [Tuber melanosporum]CAZ85731.1 unnamed protein product [Tuber melanosporum]